MKKAIIVLAFLLTGCGAGQNMADNKTTMPPPVVAHCDVGQPCKT